MEEGVEEIGGGEEDRMKGRRSRKGQKGERGKRGQVRRPGRCLAAGFAVGEAKEFGAFRQADRCLLRVPGRSTALVTPPVTKF